MRRSVANNLNDIGKDHPTLLVATCAKWMNADREKLIRHALRTLIKRGDKSALEVIGFHHSAEVDVSATLTPKKLRIGDSLSVELAVKNTGKRPERALIDLRVHYVKQRGGTSPKVFKVGAMKIWFPSTASTLADVRPRP